MDLYPPTMSSTPALTAEDWFSGMNANPVMMSMQTGCEILTEHGDESVISVKNYCLFSLQYHRMFHVPILLGYGLSDSPVQ